MLIRYSVCVHQVDNLNAQLAATRAEIERREQVESNYLEMIGKSQLKFLGVEVDRDELRVEVQRRKRSQRAVWDYLQKVSPWSPSNDMEWSDEIFCGIDGLLQERKALRAEVKQLQSVQKELSEERDALCARCDELHMMLDHGNEK